MATMPEGITQKELDEYAKLNKGAKKIADRLKVLNEKIKTAFPKAGKFIFGNVLVNRSEADSFDAAAASKKYPLETHPEYYKSVFDATAFPPDLRAKFVTKTQRLSVDYVELSDDED